MTITTITVAAERCFNHPYEQYANLRPRVEFAASLSEGDDPDACTRELQAKAETSVEQHKQLLVDQIEKLHRSAEVMQELRQMESTIRRAQEQFSRVKKEASDLGVPVPDSFKLLGNEDDGAV